MLFSVSPSHAFPPRILTLATYLPPPNPPKQPAQRDGPHKMKRHPPSHSEKELGAKHGPNEKVLPEHRASNHDARRADPRPQRKQRHMLFPHVPPLLPLLTGSFALYNFLLLPREPLEMQPLFAHPVAVVEFLGRHVAARRVRSAVAAQQEDPRGRKVQRPCPVGREEQDADERDVVARNPVVRGRQVDGGDCV